MKSTFWLGGLVLGGTLCAFSVRADDAPTLKATKYLDVAEEQKLVDQAPPPPAPNSPEDKVDLTAILTAQSDAVRTPEVIAECKLDQHFSYKLFQSIYGEGITDESAPHFLLLMKDVEQTTGEVNNTAKNKYRRRRPYQGHPDVVKALFTVSGFSYPSGHSMASFTMAVVLGAIFPEKQQAFLDRAAQIAQSRVDAGVHYPSDIKEGEVLGRATAATLLAKAAFQRDLEAVKAEVKK